MNQHSRGFYVTAYTAKPMFTADEENPSITSFSGFPMCIPRSAADPACPSANRLNGALVYRAPFLKDMAPFAKGDYVTYSGVMNGPTKYLCHTINVENIQILTSADAGEPVYIRVEDVSIGCDFFGIINSEANKSLQVLIDLNDGSGGLTARSRTLE